MANIKVVTVSKVEQVSTHDLVYTLLANQLQSQVRSRITLSSDKIVKMLSERGVSVNSRELIGHVESMLK